MSWFIYLYRWFSYILSQWNVVTSDRRGRGKCFMTRFNLDPRHYAFQEKKSPDSPRFIYFSVVYLNFSQTSSLFSNPYQRLLWINYYTASRVSSSRSISPPTHECWFPIHRMRFLRLHVSKLSLGIRVSYSIWWRKVDWVRFDLWYWSRPQEVWDISLIVACQVLMASRIIERCILALLPRSGNLLDNSGNRGRIGVRSSEGQTRRRLLLRTRNRRNRFGVKFVSATDISWNCLGILHSQILNWVPSKDGLSLNVIKPSGNGSEWIPVC